MKTSITSVLSIGAALVLGLSAAPVRADNPYKLRTSLFSPTGATGDGFGAVAISGTRMVVGASEDDTGATGAGRAFVYDLSSGTPVLLYPINNPSPLANDHFGAALALSGSWLVVGANGSNPGGKIVVFDLASATPTVPIATRSNPNPVIPGNTTGGAFGSSVAIDGQRIVVGAPANNAGGFGGAGLAYVYDFTSGINNNAPLTLFRTSPGNNDFFGTSVGISVTKVVVGAYGASVGAGGSGIAYVFDLTAGNPNSTPLTLIHPSPASSDLFGASAAISGSRVIVGSIYRGVFIYNLASGSPGTPILHLIDPGVSPGFHYFGLACALYGNRLAVGAPFDSTDGNNAGRAYIFDLAGATPTIPYATLANPTPAANDYYGIGVALGAGDIVAVGASGDDTIAADAGAVYVFGPNPDADGDGLLDAWENQWWGTTTGHAAGDDSDGDGLSNLLEEAFGLNPTAPDSAGQPPVLAEGGYLTRVLCS